MKSPGLKLGIIFVALVFILTACGKSEEDILGQMALEYAEQNKISEVVISECVTWKKGSKCKSIDDSPGCVGECQEFKDVKQISYASEEESTAETFKGFLEDISKRKAENNSTLQYFKTDKPDEWILKYSFGQIFSKKNDTWYKTKDATTTAEISFWNDFIKYASADTATSGPSQDTSVASNVPTVNQNAQTVIWIQTNSGVQRGFWKFALPAGSGTISAITANLYNSSRGATQPNIRVHSVTRSDWVEDQITWNVYKTSNNWTTAGGDYSATVIDHYTARTTNGYDTFAVLGAGADNALTLDWEDSFDIIVKYETEGGTQYYAGYKPRELATSAQLPYLEITYTAAEPPASAPYYSSEWFD